LSFATELLPDRKEGKGGSGYEKRNMEDIVLDPPRENFESLKAGSRMRNY